MEKISPEKLGSQAYETAGDWAGWLASEGDPFNDHAGPFFHRMDDTGHAECAMRVESKHINGGGTLHGGAMMTFADYCLYAFSATLGNGHAVTVSLQGDYLGVVPLGALLVCRGEVTKRTRSMAFVRGLMSVDNSPVFSFSGVLKVRSPHPSAAQATTLTSAAGL